VKVRRLRLRPAHRFPRHAHDRWSFGLIDAGSVRLGSAGTWSLSGPGAATALRPGQAHEGVVDRDAGLMYLTVSVPPDVAERAVGTASLSFRDLACPAAPVRQLIAAAAVREHEERQARILTALTSVFTGADRAVPRPTADHLGVAAKRLVDARYLEPVSLDVLAADLDTTPATLIRAFGLHAGLSPYAYVLSRRVDLARQLLEAGVRPAGVAQRTGFYDQAHLTRHFTRIVGVPPGAYRRV
jgi:AraC-like DNA-binding protein